MCSKEEVRDVVRSEAPSKVPAIILNVFSAGIVILLSWLLYDAHQKDIVIEEGKRINQVALATITGKIELLSTNLANIKEVAISRSSDRYTGSQARSDKALIKEQIKALHRRHDMSQERQSRQDVRLSTLEKTVKEHHSRPSSYK